MAPNFPPIYTAERKLQEAKRESLPQNFAGRDNISGGMIANIQADISSLREDIAHLKSLVQQGLGIGDDRTSPVEVPSQEHSPAQDDVRQLKTELRALSVCIQQTKAEIATIGTSDHTGHFNVVSCELDAVVASTEQATSDILDSVERVDTLIRNIQTQTSDAYVNSMIDEILEKIVNVFEACNFQDITGQRITKVVKTLKFVEERVNAMIEIWGGEAIAEAAVQSTQKSEDHEASLLNGPARDGDGCKQSDVDALFD